MVLRSVGLVLSLALLVAFPNSLSLAAQYGREGNTVPLRVPVCRPSPTRTEAGFSQMQRGAHAAAGPGHVTPQFNCPPALPRPSRRASDSPPSGPLSALYTVVTFPFRMLSEAASRESGYAPPVCPPPLCSPMKPPSGGSVYVPSAARRGPDGLYRAAYDNPPRH
jgi:hypothetical protein